MMIRRVTPQYTHPFYCVLCFVLNASGALLSLLYISHHTFTCLHLLYSKCAHGELRLFSPCFLRLSSLSKVQTSTHYKCVCVLLFYPSYMFHMYNIAHFLILDFFMAVMITMIISTITGLSYYMNEWNYTHQL